MLGQELVEKFKTGEIYEPSEQKTEIETNYSFECKERKDDPNEKDEDDEIDKFNVNLLK
jgi:hypothetical protein